MLKHIMKPLKKSNVLLLLAMSLSNLVNASNNDFAKSIEIDSRYSAVNAKQKTSIFREDVHIVQGSLAIDAEEVEVIAGEGKGKEVFVARGTPATYTQTLQNGSVVSASANEIRYEVTDRTLTLSGSAELSQDSSKVQSNIIVFNIEKQELIAQADAEKEQRVKTIFNPSDFGTLAPEQTKEDN